jgi:protein TonB
MHATSDPQRLRRLRESIGRRGAGLLLALAVEALLIALFLALGTRLTSDEPPTSSLTSFDVATGDIAEPIPRENRESRAKSGARQPTRAPEPVPPQPRPEPPIPPPAVELPSNIIWLSRRDYAAADLRNAPTRPATETAASGAGETGAATGDKDSQLAEGRGPNGEPLYNAEWYTRPTRAQLSTYMPARARQSGWGLIACRTVDRYRVEDCRELGSSPPGSGLAGAVRQAAWQFRVRPPRVGGRELVGAWVSIRIDYTIERGD